MEQINKFQHVNADLPMQTLLAQQIKLKELIEEAEQSDVVEWVDVDGEIERIFK